ncbi:MAG: pneumococcal-type histidine triad protein [Aerococcaceae bacterium]|nr:pneumococcal-type histidine triad protein [Aerococcaceae bacterium]
MKLSQFIHLTSSVLLLSSVAAQPVAAESSSIQYVEGASSAKPTNTEKNIEQINAEEGIDSEQIIVKITAEGFVTSHGDHYHYYNGKVPAASILSESLLTDAAYQLKQSDIVSDIENGHIVKIKDDYLVYLTDPQKRDNIRTLDEVVLQSYGVHPRDARNIVALKEEYQVAKESLIHYELERTLEDVDKANKSTAEHVVVYLADNVFVTLYGFDFYVFPKEVPNNVVFSDRLLTPTSYTLDQKDIKKQLDELYIVKVKDTYYIHVKEGVVASNIRSFQKVQTAAKASHDKFVKEGGQRLDTQAAASTTTASNGSGSRDNAGHYVTDDGYVFSPYHVIQDLGDGFIVPHDDHFHFIPKADLTAAELEIAYSVLRDRTGTVTTTPTHSNLHTRTETPSNDAPYTTSDGYVFSVESITSVTEDGIIAKHDSHFHYVPFADLSPNELAAAKAYIQQHFNKNIAAAPVTNTPKPTPTTPTPVVEVKEESQLAKLLKQLYALPVDQRHREGDGLVFDPTLVTKKTGQGYVIPHDDHFHVIPFEKLSDLERQATELYLIERGSQVAITTPTENPKEDTTVAEKPKDDTPKEEKPAEDTPTTTDTTNPTQPEDTDTEDSGTGNSDTDDRDEDDFPTRPYPVRVDLTSKKIRKTAKGMDGKDYTTSDGYEFTAESILEYDQDGLVVSHGDHTHYVPYHELEDRELQAAEDFINRRGVTAVETSTDTQDEKTAKLTYLALISGVPLDKLEVRGKYVVIPHGDHSHTANLDDVPAILRKEDTRFEDDEYRETLITLKMGLLRSQTGIFDVVRKDDTVTVTYKDGRTETKNLKDIKLPLNYEEVDYSDLKTAEHPHEAKMTYIAQQYRVPRSRVYWLDGDIVNVDYRYTVLLSKVDINDPVIYTLKDNPLPDEEETETPLPTETETQPTDNTADDTAADEEEEETPAPPATDSRSVFMNYLRNYYGAELEDVFYVRGIGYVLVPASGADNVTVTESQVESAYYGGGTLPTLDADFDFEDEDYTEEDSETTEETETTEEHSETDPAADTEGTEPTEPTGDGN